MMGLLIVMGSVLVLALIICINICFSLEFQKVAKSKGYYSSKYFWYCLLGGIAGYILVLALPDKFAAKTDKGLIKDAAEELPEL